MRNSNSKTPFGSAVEIAGERNTPARRHAPKVGSGQYLHCLPFAAISQVGIAFGVVRRTSLLPSLLKSPVPAILQLVGTTPKLVTDDTCICVIDSNMLPSSVANPWRARRPTCWLVMPDGFIARASSRLVHLVDPAKFGNNFWGW
jgi:hypothetical protein